MACPSTNVPVFVAASDSSDEDEVVDTVKYTICGILASPHFDRKAILQRSLKVQCNFEQQLFSSLNLLYRSVLEKQKQLPVRK